MNKTKIAFVVAMATTACAGCEQSSSITRKFRDAGVEADAVSCRHLYDRTCYDLTVPDPTGIVPLVGHYIVRPVDASSTAEPLGYYGFNVTEDKYHDGPYIVITMDTFRYDNLPLDKGVFSLIHGASFDGTYFPSDGYTIYGSFVAPNEAHGVFQYMPMLVQHPECKYVATLETKGDAGAN
jgi:hypothetical protein